jgi:acetyl-CoA synthetase
VFRGGKRLPLYDKVVGCGTTATAVVLPLEPDGSWWGRAASTADPHADPRADSHGSGCSVTPLRLGDLSWAAFLAVASEADVAAFAPAAADVYDTTNILFSSGTTVRWRCEQATVWHTTSNTPGTPPLAMPAARCCPTSQDPAIRYIEPECCAHVLCCGVDVLLRQGEPKAIGWTHLTPLRCLLDGWACLDVRPGSVVAWPTSLGWMMGGLRGNCGIWGQHCGWEGWRGVAGASGEGGGGGGRGEATFQAHTCQTHARIIHTHAYPHVLHTPVRVCMCVPLQGPGWCTRGS